MLATVVWLAYLASVPRVTDRFTEFYILDLQGKIDDYPQFLKVGDTGRLIVGISNLERETAEYRLEIVVNGNVQQTVGPISLQYKEKWENEVGFTVDTSGNNQKVELFLYRAGQSQPYRGPLRLLVNVR